MSENSEVRREFLTVEQALAMLPDGDFIHTFRNSPGTLLGADWSRAEIEKAIRETDCRELAGQIATDMKHGLVIQRGGNLFIATKEIK